MDFAGVRDREVTFAESGITVVEGPNESGKTTLLKAFDLLLNFLDSSQDKRVAAARPAGTGLGPSVEAEFVTGGHHVRYLKRWLSQPRTEADIVSPDGRLRRLAGREAHDAVRLMLDETLDSGLWAALQVQQGTSLDLPHFGDSTSLRQALNQAASGNLGGAAEDALHQRVLSERERYLSPTGSVASRGERGPLQAAREKEGQARAALAAAETAFTDADATSRSLAADRSRLQSTDRDLDQAKGDLARAEVERADLEAAERRVGQLREAHQQADLRHRNSLLLQGGRRELVRRSDESRSQHANLRRGLEDVSAASHAASQKLGAAQEEYRAAQSALAQAQAAAQLAERDQGQLQRLADLSPLRERLGRVRDLEDKIKAIEAQLPALLVTDDALRGIEDLQAKSERARAKLQAGAARLCLTAARDLALQVDGVPTELPAGATLERIASHDLQVEVAGLLHLEVQGGGTAADLARRAAEAEDALRESLAACSVATLEDARDVNRRLARLQAQREELGRSLAEALAADTPDLIAGRIGQIESQVDAYWAERPEEPPRPADLQQAQAALDAARTALAAAAAAKEQAGDALSLVTTAKAKADEKVGIYGSQLADAEAAAARAEEELAQARQKVSDAELEGAVLAAQAELTETWGTLAREEQAFRERNPDRVAATHLNAQQRLARLQGELEQLRQSIARSEGYLEKVALEGVGLEERLASAREDLQRAAAALVAEERRARAADLLYRTLDRHLETALRAYREPYRQEVEHLGRLVFGSDFAVDLGDDLAIEARTLHGSTLPAGQLSSGAREQLGVIGRLACSRLVSGEGVPVVLDDAFSYSDPERLTGLCLALDRAGTSGQVVLLTCDPERYRSLGDAKVLRLQAAPAPPVSAHYEPSAVEVRAAADAGGVAASLSEDRVLLALRASSSPLGKREILASAAVSEAEWGRTIHALLESGLVEQIGAKRGAVYRARGSALSS